MGLHTKPQFSLPIYPIIFSLNQYFDFVFSTCWIEIRGAPKRALSGHWNKVLGHPLYVLDDCINCLVQRKKVLFRM